MKYLRPLTFALALGLALAAVLGCAPEAPSPVVPDEQAPLLVYSSLMLSAMPSTATPADQYVDPVTVNNPMGAGTAIVDAVLTKDLGSNPMTLAFEGTITYDGWSVPASQGGAIVMNGELDLDFQLSILTVAGVGATSTMTYRFSGSLSISDGDRSTPYDIDVTVTTVTQMDESSALVSSEMSIEGTVNGTTIHEST